MVTARELVLSGSVTSHSMSVRRHRHFTWSCEPQEIHSSQCWRVRNKSSQTSPTNGNRTRATGMIGKDCTSHSIAPPSSRESTCHITGLHLLSLRHAVSDGSHRMDEIGKGLLHKADTADLENTRLIIRSIWIMLETDGDADRLLASGKPVWNCNPRGW